MITKTNLTPDELIKISIKTLKGAMRLSDDDSSASKSIRLDEAIDLLTHAREKLDVIWQANVGEAK